MLPKRRISNHPNGVKTQAARVERKPRRLIYLWWTRLKTLTNSLAIMSSSGGVEKRGSAATVRVSPWRRSPNLVTMEALRPTSFICQHYQLYSFSSKYHAEPFLGMRSMSQEKAKMYLVFRSRRLYTLHKSEGDVHYDTC